MAMQKSEVADWLDSLPDDAVIGIDDGATCLRVVGDPEPYLEIGCLPLDEPDRSDRSVLLSPPRECFWLDPTKPDAGL